MNNASLRGQAAGEGVRRLLRRERREIAEAAKFIPLNDEQRTSSGAPPRARRLTERLEAVKIDAGAHTVGAGPPPGRSCTAPPLTCTAAPGRVRQSSMAMLRRGAALGRDHVGIVVSLLVPALDFFARSRRGLPHGTRWAPTFAGPTSASAARHGDRSGRRRSRCSWRCRSDSARPSTCPSTPATRTRKVLKPMLEVLAGIPSVVYGFFALTSSRPTSCRTACTSTSAHQRAGRWPRPRA